MLSRKDVDRALFRCRLTPRFLTLAAIMVRIRANFVVFYTIRPPKVVGLYTRPLIQQEGLRVNCYVCVLEGQTSASVATCTRCGVAMCLRHFNEAQGYSVGGTKYGCPHALAKAAAT